MNEWINVVIDGKKLYVKVADLILYEQGKLKQLKTWEEHKEEDHEEYLRKYQAAREQKKERKKRRASSYRRNYYQRRKAVVEIKAIRQQLREIRDQALEDARQRRLEKTRQDAKDWEVYNTQRRQKFLENREARRKEKLRLRGLIAERQKKYQYLVEESKRVIACPPPLCHCGRYKDEAEIECEWCRNLERTNIIIDLWFDGESLEEISAFICVTRERIRQVINRVPGATHMMGVPMSHGKKRQ